MPTQNKSFVEFAGFLPGGKYEILGPGCEFSKWDLPVGIGLIGVVYIVVSWIHGLIGL